MITRSFYFIRHGQTDCNAENRLQGQLDTPLNNQGMKQADDAEKIISHLNITLMCSSPLLRASQTAEIINANKKLPVIYHPNLKEYSFGLFEGKNKQEIEIIKKEKNLDFTGKPIEPTGYPAPPEGETFAALSARAVSAVNEILENHKGDILFVSHGGVFSALTYNLIGDGIYRKSDNCVPYHFIKESENKWMIKNLKTCEITGENP